MDDWFDEAPSLHSEISTDVDVEEHLKSMTFSRILLSLIQRGNEIDNLCTIYEDIYGEPVALTDFKLKTPQDIETLVSIAQVFATEDVPEPRAYLDKLTLKPRKQRGEQPHKSVHLGGLTTVSASEGIKAMEALSSDSDLKKLKTFSRHQLLHIVLQVMKDNKAGQSSSFAIDRGADRLIFNDVQIDTDDDLESLSTMLEAYTSVPQDVPVDRPSAEIRFSELVKTYLPQRLRNLARQQNRAHAESAMQLFAEYFNDDPFVHTISRELAEDLFNVVRKLPPNRKIRRETKHLSLSELLKQEWPITLGTQGVSKYTTEWRQLYQYAIETGYAVSNPFQNITPLKKNRKNSEERADKKGRSFNQTELKKIFSTSVFTDKASRSYYFWVPLLCLYTGGRVNEIAQLDIDDIVHEQGVWCIDINAHGADKSVKNEASKRLVPVHRDLIELGFLRYVETIRAAKADPKTTVYRTNKLWWDIYMVSGKYANACNKVIQSIFKEAGITRTGDKYHGFRHSLIGLLKQAGVDESTYGEILGHDISLRSGGLYGDHHTPKTLKNALEKVNPLPREVIEAMKPYGLPRTLLPQNDWKRFDRKKYLADLSNDITDARLLKKIASWS